MTAIEAIAMKITIATDASMCPLDLLAVLYLENILLSLPIPVIYTLFKPLINYKINYSASLIPCLG